MSINLKSPVATDDKDGNRSSALLKTINFFPLWLPKRIARDLLKIFFSGDVLAWSLIEKLVS